MKMKVPMPEGTPDTPENRKKMADFCKGEDHIPMFDSVETSIRQFKLNLDIFSSRDDVVYHDAVVCVETRSFSPIFACSVRKALGDRFGELALQAIEKVSVAKVIVESIIED